MQLDAATAEVTSFPTAREAVAAGAPLPQGVIIRELIQRPDARGDFCEVFRESWELSDPPAQWSMVRSQAGVMRGVHAHHRHVDYLTVAAGGMLLGLHDLRPTSPTHGCSTMLWLEGDDPHLVVVPMWVAHGFYFREPCLHIYGVSAEFDAGVEYGCRWDDPGLKLPWPCTAPIVSERDRAAGSLAALVAAFEAHRGA